MPVVAWSDASSYCSLAECPHFAARAARCKRRANPCGSCSDPLPCIAAGSFDGIPCPRPPSPGHFAAKCRALLPAAPHCSLPAPTSGGATIGQNHRSHGKLVWPTLCARAQRGQADARTAASGRSLVATTAALDRVGATGATGCLPGRQEASISLRLHPLQCITRRCMLWQSSQPPSTRQITLICGTTAAGQDRAAFNRRSDR